MVGFVNTSIVHFSEFNENFDQLIYSNEKLNESKTNDKHLKI